MIKITVNREEVKPVVPPIRSVTIELSEGAALTIACLCGEVIGNVEKSFRIHTDKLYDELGNIFGERFYEFNEQFYKPPSHLLEFKSLEGDNIKYLK